MCGLCFQIRLFNLVLFLFTLDRSDFILPYYSWRVINAQVPACEAPQQLKYSWISKAESGDWQRYLIKSYWANKYSRSTSALLTASREELLRNRLCSLIEMRQHLMLLHLWELGSFLSPGECWIPLGNLYYLTWFWDFYQANFFCLCLITFIRCNILSSKLAH